MKNEMTPAPWLYLLAVPAFLLPLVYVYHATGQWNPFAINGRHFLWCYGYGVIMGYAAVILPVLLRRDTGLFPFMKGVVMTLLIVGVIRLCQGLFNGKPVGYLFCLLISLLVLWWLTRVLYAKKR